MRMANPPDGLPRVVAHLIYADVDAAVEWLYRVFGFEERVFARHLGEDGRIGRTQLQVEDSVITVGSFNFPESVLLGEIYAQPSRGAAARCGPRRDSGRGSWSRRRS